MLICSLLFASWICFQPAPTIEIVEVSQVARVTCYNDSGIMASGDYTYPGAVAVSDRSIPLKTQIYVEGYGIMTVEDRTALWVHDRGFTIDIYDPNCDLKFGVKKLTYKLL